MPSPLHTVNITVYLFIVKPTSAGGIIAVSVAGIKHGCALSCKEQLKNIQILKQKNIQMNIQIGFSETVFNRLKPSFSTAIFKVESTIQISVKEHSQFSVSTSEKTK